MVMRYTIRAGQIDYDLAEVDYWPDPNGKWMRFDEFDEETENIPRYEIYAEITIFGADLDIVEDEFGHWINIFDL
jgi:hypothetical protein